MALNLSRDDIKTVGDNMYQIGSVEFEIIPGSPGLGFKNVETEDAGTASLEEVGKEFGEDIASFFRERLSQEHVQ